MCNLPPQIHEDIETRTQRRKTKPTKEDGLKISVSHLPTLYPTVN